MTNKLLREKLKKLGACAPAMRWLGKRTSAQMWEDCRRGDYMYWLIDELSWVKCISFTISEILRLHISEIIRTHWKQWQFVKPSRTK